MAITEKQVAPFSHSLQEAKDIVNIPSGIIEVLRNMATSHMDVDSQQETFDKFADRDVRAALAIMAESPSGVQTGPETVLSLVHNPDSAENQKFLSKNPAFFQAFPILKQIYKHEKAVDEEDYEAANKLDQERDMAIDDFEKMFGKGNLPEGLKHRTERKLEAIEKRKKELDKKIPQEKKWFKEFEAMGKEPSTDKKTDEEKPDFIVGLPMRADKEVEKNVKLQEEMDKLESGYSPTGGPYVQDVPTERTTIEGRPGAQHPFFDERSTPGAQRPFFDTDGERVEREVDEARTSRPRTREDYDYLDTERPEEVREQYKERYSVPRQVYLPDKEEEEKEDEYTYLMREEGGRQRGGMVSYQEGGDVPLEADPAYNEPSMGFVGTPPEAAIDQANAAQNGEMGGDNVKTEVPEGSFVLNSYAVELAGIKDIEKLINDAKKFLMEGMEGETGFATQTPTGEDVAVRVSEGEYIIPPALVRIIGRDRLEKINKRGIAEFERQQTAETEEGGLLEAPQESEGFMPPEAPMPPEAGGAPMPPEQVQGFAVGTVNGGVQQQGVAGNPAQPTQPTQIQQAQKQGVTGPEIGITNQTLQMALMAKLPSAPKPKQHKVASLQPKVGGPRIGGQPGQPGQPVQPGQPQKPKGLPMGGVGVNMGGFVPYSRYG